MSLPRRCEDRSCQRRRPYVWRPPSGVLTFCMFLSLSVSHILMCAVFFYGRTWVAWKRQDRPFGWPALCHGFSLLTCLSEAKLPCWAPAVGPAALALASWSSMGMLCGGPLATPTVPPNPTLINCEDCNSGTVFWTLRSSQSRGRRTFFLPL